MGFPPDRALAEDLVLTRTQAGHKVGRIRLSMPEYRLVSASAGESLGEGPPVVTEGDTIWVTSRGKSWAFSLERIPGVSRVAAPVGVRFVRGPRPTGWALPSSEACGDDAHRCAVLSTKPLPPPQAHFDLSGFGLDTARYSLLARLETDRDGVRIVGADFEARFGYGEIHPISALPVSESLPPTGILVSVHRAAQGQQAAVLVTVLGLFVLILGALATVSGDPRIWERRKATSPNMSAAWGFVNVFLIFLGIRLALGLRVAYSPPFYDRAAETAVGLWITFALMLVALGRWSSWAPLFWRLVRYLERPVSRMFLPGVNGNGASAEDSAADSPDAPEGESPGSGRANAGPFSVGWNPDSADGKRAIRRGRYRTAFGVLLMLFSLCLLIWQRPEVAASFLVAATGIGAWLGMGLTRRRSSGASLNQHPLSVITTEEGGESPALSLGLAAGGSVILAMAIHAPGLALVPVLGLLFLFGANLVLGWWKPTRPSKRRATALFILVLATSEIGILAFFPWPGAGTAGLAAAGLAAGLILGRAPKKGAKHSSPADTGVFCRWAGPFSPVWDG